MRSLWRCKWPSMFIRRSTHISYKQSTQDIGWAWQPQTKFHPQKLGKYSREKRMIMDHEPSPLPSYPALTSPARSSPHRLTGTSLLVNAPPVSSLTNCVISVSLVVKNTVRWLPPLWSSNAVTLICVPGTLTTPGIVIHRSQGRHLWQARW